MNPYMTAATAALLWAATSGPAEACSGGTCWMPEQATCEGDQETREAEAVAKLRTCRDEASKSVLGLRRVSPSRRVACMSDQGLQPVSESTHTSYERFCMIVKRLESTTDDDPSIVVRASTPES